MRHGDPRASRAAGTSLLRELDSAILRATEPGVVRCDGLRLTEALRIEACGRDAARLDGLLDGLVLAALALLLVCDCKMKSCASRSADVKVKMGSLAADPLAGARELGTAAASEKDEDVLEGKLLAFLERVGVPVVARDGKDLIAKAPYDPPRTVMLWEPSVAGLARGAARGVTLPMAMLVRAVVKGVPEEALAATDWALVFRELAASVTPADAPSQDAMVVTAIAEDLKLRKESGARARIDPVGGALFVFWLSLAKPGAPAAAPSAIPGLPPGFKLPGFTPPPTRNQLGSKVAKGICKLLNHEALKKKGGESTNGGWGSKLAGLFPGASRALPPKTGELFKAISTAVKGAIPTSAIVGVVMTVAISMLIDASGGKVTPEQVKYGDGPAKFEMKVTSSNPLDEGEMEALVECLKAAFGESELFEDLEHVPPNGDVDGLPVVWLQAEQFHPKHGKFKGDVGQPQWLPKFLDVHNRNVGKVLEEGGISLTSKGTARAEFQVKNEKRERGLDVVKSYLVIAHVLPFPAPSASWKGVIYTDANIFFGPQVPVRFEIRHKLPPKWIMKIKQSTLSTGGGLQGGWKVELVGDVPFTIDTANKNLKLEGKGSGSWSFLFEGGSSGRRRGVPSAEDGKRAHVRGQRQRRLRIPRRHVRPRCTRSGRGRLAALLLQPSHGRSRRRLRCAARSARATSLPGRPWRNSR